MRPCICFSLGAFKVEKVFMMSQIMISKLKLTIIKKFHVMFTVNFFWEDFFIKATFPLVVKHNDDCVSF